MTKEVMQRNASDNEYLHKDFHLSMNVGITFLHKNYGEEGVIDYIRKFAKTYYAPVIDHMVNGDIRPLYEHLKKIYGIEKADVQIDFETDQMTVTLAKNPAFDHFEKMHVMPSPMYKHTVATLYDAICEDTPFDFELLSYDEKTGASKHRFVRRVT